MPNFEILSQRKKEIMDEVSRLADGGFHHFYWRLKDPESACTICKRRHDRLLNAYEIKYKLDLEYCVSEDDICPYELDPLKPKTVYQERDRQLAVLKELEEGGAKGVRWVAPDGDLACDPSLRRHKRLFTMEQVRKELDGDFCIFADPARGCECTFNVAPDDEVAALQAQMEALAEAEVETTSRKGCGSSAALFMAFAAACSYWLA